MPGRAEAALQPVHLAEAFLQRVQRAVGRGHAFDGADLGAVRLHGEHGAGLHRFAIEIDGAGAAMAGVAADMRAGEVSCSRRKWMSSVRGSTSASTALPFTVIETWDFGHVLSRYQRARAWARASARASITPAILVR